MPLMYGKDKDGLYVKWGKSGAKYHYKAGNTRSRSQAVDKAKRQAAAIKARQNKGK